MGVKKISKGLFSTYTSTYGRDSQLSISQFQNDVLSSDKYFSGKFQSVAGVSIEWQD